MTAAIARASSKVNRTAARVGSRSGNAVRSTATRTAATTIATAAATGIETNSDVASPRAIAPATTGTAPSAFTIKDNETTDAIRACYADIRILAFARGYSDGWDHGADDRHDRDRYDPVRHGDYRSADDGYSRSYGSKDAYKNNYRSGFRQGYDSGYRNGERYR